ncbi:MAG: hypothetical protein DCC65_13055 [Planctomycetota bacterium]|nr:MAG: hypothetical protein DCC65_13055 [Planctomycetota bacterium]
MTTAPGQFPPLDRQRDVLGRVAVFCAVAVYLVIGWSKLGSVDLGYHIAYGRHFLDTGTIVERDPFLYPEVARPFVNANWGSQILIALAERIGGSHGLITLRMILLLFILGGIVVAMRRSSRGLHWLAWAIVLAALAAYERFTLRPELFSYALMMAVVAVLTGGVTSLRHVIAVAVLQLAWVNSHSYFLVGLLLTCAVLAGQLIQLWRTNANGAQREAQRRGARLLTLALAAQIAVCFINPWFARGAYFPIETLQYLKSARVMGGAEGWSGESAWSAISEFKSPFAFLGQPVNFRTIHAYLLLLAVCVPAIPALIVHRRWGQLFMLLGLLAMSTQMRRNIAQFALAGAPLAMIALAGLPAWSAEAARAARQVRAVLLLVTIGLAGWWTYGIIEGRFYYVERRVNRVFGTGYNERVFPIGAARWIAENADQLSPNLYVNYFASSNTLPWLPAKFPIFVDTNTFAYPEDALAMAYRLGLGQSDHAEFFERYGVNIVLLHCGSDTQMLVRKLADDFTNWALVYFDRTSVIFLRRTVAHVKLILANPRSERDLDPAKWLSEMRGGRRQRTIDIGLACGVPLALGWHQKALGLAEEAVRASPDYHEGWQFAAVCHGNLGNDAALAGNYDTALAEYQKALECFAKVLTIVPGHVEALRYVEVTLAKMQQVQNRQAQEATGLSPG